MSSVDERVVGMKFDNAQFEQGVKQTQTSLGNLNKSLQLQEGTKGLQNVSAAAKNVQLGHIATAVDAIASKFTAMGAIAFSTLQNITNRAISAGVSIAKSLTIDPIKQGLQEYETNLNSIQTILANTQASGATLKDVNAALNELNHYSDQTIYNFSEMARNIGTFTAAGVGLDKATASIKGIANLAALSGSNSQQAAGAMYQLSQAIAAGKVSLMDWNSVVNAGMGGATFQRALAETAVAMGELDSGALKLSGKMKTVTIDGQSFRDSITASNGESWLTSDVLTNTLSQFTGDLSKAELKAMGFKDAQIAAIQQMAQTAKHAATEVKTMSGLLDTAKEAAGSGWAQTWQLIFGDFEEAKSMWTAASGVINGMIEKSADARNKILGDWKALGGRTAMIDTVKNVWNALGSVITPIKDAFKQIFPPTTGKQLADITKSIRDFTAGLKIGGTTANNLKRTFAGVFAIFGIGWDILKEVGKTLLSLFQTVSGGDGSFLKMTASVGDFLVALREAIQKGEGLKKFFNGLRTVLAYPIKLLQSFGKWLTEAFKPMKEVDLSGLDKMKERLSPLARLGDMIKKAWAGIGNVFKNTGNVIKGLLEKLPDFISDGLAGLDYDKALDGLNTGLFAAFTAIMAGFFRNGFKFDLAGMFGFNSKMFGNNSLGDMFDEVTGTLKAMQSQLHSKTLMQLAGAIALLAASLVAMSLIDSGKLTAATTALGGLMAGLMGAFAAFTKIADWKGSAQLPLIATGLILLAIALDLLVIAVTALAKLSWEELAKGLLGLVVMLGALIGMMKLMPDQKRMISTGVGLLLLSVGIKILASAVTDLSGLSWEDMAKGLLGVGALLGALGLFTKFAKLDKGGMTQGVGLLLMAVGVKILASAFEEFAGFSWEEIGRGILAMAGSLALVTAALMLIPPTAPLAAAAVLITAIAMKEVGLALEQMGQLSWGEIGKGLTAMLGALTMISVAVSLIPPTAPLGAAAILIVAMSLAQVGAFLQSMSQLSWEEIGKAMVVLAGSLILITNAVAGMTGSLMGAAAMLVVAAALNILLPVLMAFSQMTWEEIGKGLLMLAGVFLVLGVAGLVLTPVVPMIVALGIAVGLLGIGMLAAGAGMFLFATALTVLSVAGAAGTAALVVLVTAMINLLPLLGQKIGEAVVMFAKVIAAAGPAITKAIVTVLTSLINAINIMAPKIVNTLLRLLTMMLNQLSIYVPQMVRAGLRLLTGILSGIADNIYKIVTVAVRIITEFLRGIGDNIGKITKAGADLIIKFVNSLADTIESRSAEMGEAGGRLASAIIRGMVKGLSSGAGEVASAAKSAAKAALNAAKSLLGIHSPSKEFFKIGRYSDEGMAQGFKAYAPMVGKSAAEVGKHALDRMRESMSKSDVWTKDIDAQPTIRPVLDLSSVKKNAGQIGKVLGGHKLSTSATLTSAREAGAGYLENLDRIREQQFSNHTEMTYIQNNTSPKALSNAEIYRQTKSQLSRTKGVLTSSVNNG